ncbi:tyrosine--tRNA ligase [Mycoplasma sp. P36-A1]|uniref:tyrosine--tRNA ligase n=1 Tax=Mycoplasma sp. P36-A1 TaxID=3252900 RepID=UPI003C2B2C67
MYQDIIAELKWRGLINQVTDQDKLESILKNQTKIYVGVDPTADSMHIGHLLPILLLKRFMNYGHIPVPLMGGGTGQIGDPSGRNSERVLLDTVTIDQNVEKIRKQVEHIFKIANKDDYLLLNNKDWIEKISLLDFLRDYGKFFNVNTMLAKDIVANRLDSGISFTEFSYQILQSIDWLTMYDNHKVQIQIGGSDQWGNITAGTDLIRKKRPEAQVCGITMPLITKSDGTKFGKTAGGAIWLDREKTSPYELYQFFLNSADADVVHYLKVFTFLSEEEITDLAKQVEEKPHERAAQKALAKEVTIMIHSQEDYDKAIEISKALFSGDISNLDIKTIESSFDQVPNKQLEKIIELNIIDFLVQNEIVKSKREAREFVTNNSITINGIKVNDVEFNVKKEDAFDERVTIVRRGKKTYTKVSWC